MKPQSVTIQPDGQFDSFEQWCNKARSWIGGTGAACFDQKGRLCASGKDFKQAQDEDAFPVVYVFPAEGPWVTPAAQRERLGD